MLSTGVGQKAGKGWKKGNFCGVGHFSVGFLVGWLVLVLQRNHCGQE